MNERFQQHGAVLPRIGADERGSGAGEPRMNEPTTEARRHGEKESRSAANQREPKKARESPVIATESHRIEENRSINENWQFL
jgi:hypothetical protein